MNKSIKRFLVGFLFLFALTIPSLSYANQLNSIDMEIDIDEAGIGHVTEVWETVEEDRSATEKYKVISDLNGIKIRDFSVSANGYAFEEKSPWDIDASFRQKSYHYGMIDEGDRVELCWGITKFDENTYTLRYVIDPVVVGLNDYDMVYFRFIKENLDPLPEKISIKLNGYEPFDEDVSMWAMGFEGDIHNVDGSILAESTGQVNYAVIMLRFPKGTFDTAYTIEEDFSYYRDMAIEGSDWEVDDSYSQTSNYGDSNYEDDSFFDFDRIMDVLWILLIPFSIILGIYETIKKSKQYKIRNKRELKKESKFKDQYFREIPYDGPMEDTYLLAKHAFKDNHFQNYMNAFFLKWIYEGAISFAEDEVQKFLRTVKSSYIIINHEPINPSSIEKEFFDMIAEASEYTSDGKLRQKDIERYMKDHRSSLKSYMDEFPDYSLDALVDRGYLNNDRKYKRFNLGGKYYENHITITRDGIDLYENFIKFKNYLKDYSLIAERGVNEVKLWDTFMIYAAIYGISQEVYENFTEIYPEYAELSIYDYYMINNVNIFSTSVASFMSQSIENFESSSGGGSSSFGGGGGSFGGGSGGSGGGSR